jgi:hypothetical protein
MLNWPAFQSRSMVTSTVGQDRMLGKALPQGLPILNETITSPV